MFLGGVISEERLSSGTLSFFRSLYLPVEEAGEDGLIEAEILPISLLTMGSSRLLLELRGLRVVAFFFGFDAFGCFLLAFLAFVTFLLVPLSSRVLFAVLFFCFLLAAQDKGTSSESLLGREGALF